MQNSNLNQCYFRALERRFEGFKVSTTKEIGIDPDAKEVSSSLCYLVQCSCCMPYYVCVLYTMLPCDYVYAVRVCVGVCDVWVWVCVCTVYNNAMCILIAGSVLCFAGLPDVERTTNQCTQ